MAAVTKGPSSGVDARIESPCGPPMATLVSLGGGVSVSLSAPEMVDNSKKAWSNLQDVRARRSEEGSRRSLVSSWRWIRARVFTRPCGEVGKTPDGQPDSGGRGGWELLLREGLGLRGELGLGSGEEQELCFGREEERL